MTYEQLLTELVEDNDFLYIMTAENRAHIRQLPQKIGGKFIDVGIAEQTMIGMAAGLALQGNTVITHALASFLTMRSFEFIRTDVGIAELPVCMVGFIPGILSEANGPTHQSLEDIGLMRLIPSMNIFSPMDEEELINGMTHIVNSKNPWYIRYSNQPAKIQHKPFEIGKAEEIGEGNDIVIFSHGFLCNEALEVASQLERNGFSSKVVNMRTLRPVDEEVIIRTILDADVICIIEDHFSTGALFTIISEIIALRGLSATLLPFNLRTWHKSGLLKDVMQYETMTAEYITQKIMASLQ
jgi:transketolase